MSKPSFLERMVGIGVGSAVGNVAAPLKAVGDIVDNLFTSDEERMDKEHVRDKLIQNWDVIQANITAQEARHRTVFVAGWRPFIGWVCGIIILWDYFLVSILKQATQIAGYPTTFYASGSSDVVLEILGAMLGIAGLRTYEKVKGIAK